MAAPPGCTAPGRPGPKRREGGRCRAPPPPARPRLYRDPPGRPGPDPLAQQRPPAGHRAGGAGRRGGSRPAARRGHRRAAGDRHHGGACAQPSRPPVDRAGPRAAPPARIRPRPRYPRRSRPCCSRVPGPSRHDEPGPPFQPARVAGARSPPAHFPRPGSRRFRHDPAARRSAPRRPRAIRPAPLPPRAAPARGPLRRHSARRLAPGERRGVAAARRRWEPRPRARPRHLRPGWLPQSREPAPERERPVPALTRVRDSRPGRRHRRRRRPRPRERPGPRLPDERVAGRADRRRRPRARRSVRRDARTARRAPADQTARRFRRRRPPPPPGLSRRRSSRGERASPRSRPASRS